MAAVSVQLKHVHAIPKKLADGSVKIFYYHRRTRAPLPGVPGSPEFMAAYIAATAAPRSTDNLAALIAGFKGSADYKRLAEKTRKDYGKHFDRIGARFGTLPIEALNDKAVRGQFFEWRDEMAETPRQADYAWSVLRRLLDWAYDRGKIGVNHAARPGRLYDSDRADMSWSPEQIETFLGSEKVSVEIKEALIAALFSGQREGDLIRMAWANDHGAVYRLRQGKRKHMVDLPIHRDWRTALDGQKSRRKGPLILTTPTGLAWKLDHFRHSFRDAMVACGLGESGLHFHDLRGTAFGMLLDAGASVAEAAMFLGWSIKHAAEMADTYAPRHNGLAASAVRKLEAVVNEPRTESVNRAVNRGLGKRT